MIIKTTTAIILFFINNLINNNFKIIPLIAGEYIDSGFSGKDDKRPEFERLLTDIRANKVNTVLVYKLDRIGRSLKHLLNLFEEFKSRKVEFISLTQNINTGTPEGKMFWQMLGVFAEFEREMIVARTLAGLDRARRQGKALGRPKGKKNSGDLNRLEALDSFFRIGLVETMKDRRDFRVRPAEQNFYASLLKIPLGRI